MRNFLAVFIPSVLFSNGVTAQCAAGTAQEINGNWYCSEVTAVIYTNFPGFGSYKKITDMDASSGDCSSERYNYSGSLSPLNEELSLHIRGPTWLKQVAVYTPTTVANDKRSTKPNDHHRRHAAAAAVHHHRGHQHLHHRHGKVEEVEESQLSKRAVGDLVSATIDGQLVSWINEYAGPGVATNAPVVGAVDDTSASASNADTTEDLETTSQSPTLSSTTPTSTSSSSTQPATATSDGWSRQAYFNAASGTAEGLSFLNHFGGTDGIPGTSAGGPASGNLDHVQTEQDC